MWNGISLTCIIKISYSDSEEFYNSKNGNLHKMRIKGRKEFIPYALFEAFKVQDQGLHRCPTITLSIIKLILNSFIRQCTHSPKSKETKRSFAFPFQAHTHNTMVQRILSFYQVRLSFFCTQKAERVLGFSRRLFVC